jgi:excisionase family DNA binding protein
VSADLPDSAPSGIARAQNRPSSDWLSLAEASRLLGVSGATLRRWADDGRVPVFTTPGGHRRFSRRTLQHLLPAARIQRPPLARLGASPERIVRAYRPAGADHPAPPPWMEQMADADRIAFRERGRQFLELLVEYLDAAEPGTATARLDQATALATAQGRQAAELGAKLAEAVQAFLQFRAPFTRQMAATARRRGLDTREATELLMGAELAMDELLLATMAGHSAAAPAQAEGAGSASSPERPHAATPSGTRRRRRS